PPPCWSPPWACGRCPGPRSPRRRRPSSPRDRPRSPRSRGPGRRWRCRPARRCRSSPRPRSAWSCAPAPCA
ncbi:MAG: hypothetical protein EYC70_10825, partial [Planctomycetota bacterium]